MIATTTPQHDNTLHVQLKQDGLLASLAGAHTCGRGLLAEVRLRYSATVGSTMHVPTPQQYTRNLPHTPMQHRQRSTTIQPQAQQQHHHTTYGRGLPTDVRLRYSATGSMATSVVGEQHTTPLHCTHTMHA